VPRDLKYSQDVPTTGLGGRTLALFNFACTAFGCRVAQAKPRADTRLGSVPIRDDA
jgi:hypothetical protein